MYPGVTLCHLLESALEEPLLSDLYQERKRFPSEPELEDERYQGFFCSL